MASRNAESRHEEVTDRALQDAVELASDVRELDPELIWGRLATWSQRDPVRLCAAVVALAAMVQIDEPVSRLLAWVDHLELARPEKPHAELALAVAAADCEKEPSVPREALLAAHSAYERFRSTGRRADAPDWVVFGERMYQRDRGRTRRAAGAG